MQIIKKNIDQLANDLETVLAGKEQGEITTMPVGAALFADRLPPQLEIILLDAEEKIVAYRARSHPDSPDVRKGSWMIGKPAAVAGEALRWAESMIEKKRRKNTTPVAAESNCPRAAAADDDQCTESTAVNRPI